MAKTIKGIQTANEFSLRKKEYLDDRQSFDTIADMAGFDDVPDGFITLNKEDRKRYIYESSNTIDTNLGKWREYKSGGSGSNYDDTQIKTDIADLQNNKVDKVSGKSLVDDTEIARLAKISNYDDTQVKSDINTLKTDKQDTTDNS